MWWIAVFRIRVCRIKEDLQDWGDAGASSCGYCLEASMTAALHCPSGLRIKSAMTGPVWLVLFYSPSPPRHPVDSRLRGNDGRFCKGLIEGEGEGCYASCCGYCLEASMTVRGIMRIFGIGTMRCIIGEMLG